MIELTTEEVQLALEALGVYRTERLVPQVSISGMFSEERQREIQEKWAQVEDLRAKLRREEPDGS